MKAPWLIAASLLGTALTATSAQAEVTPASDPVLFWNKMIAQYLTGSPVFTSRTIAMAQVAIYDAVNASSGNVNKSYTGLAANDGDVRAAASTAARDLLLKFLPPNGTDARTAQRAQIESSYQASLALVADGAAKSAGIANGTQAANNVVALRTGDGSDAPLSPVYSPTNPPVPGRYQLTGAGSAAAPWWGSVKTWTMESGSSFRPDAPPAIGSQDFIEALNEVTAIGGKTSARTAEQTASAAFWASAGGTGANAWINAAIQASEGKGLTSQQYAAMFAMLGTNIADTTIAIFDAKYYYDYWRPVTAIHALDPSSTWESFIAAPLHPSYVSGHSAIAGVAAGTLAAWLGEDQQACFTGYICFGSFALAAQDAADSRLWAGIHYSFDNEAGLALGSTIAKNGLRVNAFNAVPEPATWISLLLGFAVIGAHLRRLRRSRNRPIAALA